MREILSLQTRLFAVALGFSLALAGCAQLTNAYNIAAGVNVTQNELDTAKAGYDGLFLAPAASYRQLGYCATGASVSLAHPCAVRSVVAKLQAADAAVNVAFENVQSMITSGDNVGVSAAYQSLLNAITAAEAIAAANGVK